MIATQELFFFPWAWREGREVRSSSYFQSSICSAYLKQACGISSGGVMCAGFLMGEIKPQQSNCRRCSQFCFVSISETFSYVEMMSKCVRRFLKPSTSILSRSSFPGVCCNTAADEVVLKQNKLKLLTC